MPIEGWDHLELWVGNAKQAAYFYEHAFGFQLTAYAGPETGVRDRASYVIEQGDIRLVLTTALRGDHEIAKHVLAHGDGVKDIALTVPDATRAYREAVQRGARGVTEPHVEEDELGRVELASIATYGDTVHTFVNRSDYGGPYLPGYVAQTGNGRLGVGLRDVGRCAVTTHDPDTGVTDFDTLKTLATLSTRGAERAAPARRLRRGRRSRPRAGGRRGRAASGAASHRDIARVL